jgi:rod shape-determining protein MreC
LAVAVETRRGRFLLVALVASHLVVISNQVDGGGGASLLERGVFALLYPFQWLVASTVDGVRSGLRSYVDLRGARAENVRLKERVDYLEALLQQKQDHVREAERLRQALELKQILPIETVVAQVVAGSGQPFYRVLTIDKGRDHGVTLEAPVISPTGVVGRVVRLGPRAAVVQLLIDPQAAIAVLLERTRVNAIAGGRAVPGEDSPDLELRYTPALADVVVGDVVVTSGLDKIYPKGLAVGRVRSISPQQSGLFLDVRVEPSARFAALEEVLVVVGPAAPPDAALDEEVR